MGIGSRPISILLTLLFPCLASAQAPERTWRAWIGFADPSDGVSGNVMDMPVSVHATSTTALGFTYELRTSDLIGLEAGIWAADFDFEFDAQLLGSFKLGSSSMMPLSFGVNFHFSGDKFDFHLGPKVAYVNWSSFDSFVGDSTKVDDEFTFGLDLGVDIPVGENDWILFIGASRLNAEASNGDGVPIDVNPTTFKVGFGKRLRWIE